MRSVTESLQDWLQAGGQEIGEIRLQSIPGGWQLIHRLEVDLADLPAAIRDPCYESLGVIRHHAETTSACAASKAATCSRITSANIGSVPMALA